MSQINNLVLSEEQQMLKQSAQEFLRQHCNIETFRAERERKGVVVSNQETWAKMVDLGWSSIVLPESLDGLGFGLKGLGVINIEVGKALATTPLVPCAALGIEALLLCDETEQRNELLLALASGERCAAFAFDNDSGDLEFVPEAQAADVVLVPNAQGLNIFDLKASDKNEAAYKGVSIKPLSLLDRRDYAHIGISESAQRSVLTYREPSQGCIEYLHNVGAVLTACELFGIANEALSRTVAYVSEREQFGQKIGSFQAVQHRLAKAYTELQMCKSVVYDALSAQEHQRDDASMAVSHAKSLANDTAQLICTEAIQLHGGMGITDELDIGLFYKRARVLQSTFGSTAHHKARFAELTGL